MWIELPLAPIIEELATRTPAERRHVRLAKNNPSQLLVQPIHGLTCPPRPPLSAGVRQQTNFKHSLRFKKINSSFSPPFFPLSPRSTSNLQRTLYTPPPTSLPRHPKSQSSQTATTMPLLSALVNQQPPSPPHSLPTQHSTNTPQRYPSISFTREKDLTITPRTRNPRTQKPKSMGRKLDLQSYKGWGGGGFWGRLRRREWEETDRTNCLVV